MGIQNVQVLYPVNSTVVDSGTGIDIRLLDSAQAGATNTSQTCQATHTQDNQSRTFDPATSGITGTNATVGWALRLSEDMTPSDNTNCNAFLKNGTFNANIRVTIDQSGGTYVAGTYGPQWSAAIVEYDPVSNTPTTIVNGTDSSVTWTIAGLGADLGTFKNVQISISLPSGYEFVEGNILMLRVGLNTLTIPNPTLGTATWTYTLAVDDADTNITWASGQHMAALCPMDGAVADSGDVAAAMARVLPTVGSSDGTASIAGAMNAVGQTAGSIQGDASVSAILAGFGLTAMTIDEESDVAGSTAIVIGSEFEIDTGGGGGTTVHPVFGHNE